MSVGSVQDGANGLYDRDRNPFTTVRAGAHHNRVNRTGYDSRW